MTGTRTSFINYRCCKQRELGTEQVVLRNTCSGGGADGQIGDLEALRDSLFALQDSVGFKTDTLLSHIYDSDYDQEQLANELTGWSPLSDEVLIALCERSPALVGSDLVHVLTRNSPVTRAVWVHMQTALDSLTAPQKDSVILAQANDSIQTVGSIDFKLEAARSNRFQAIVGQLEILTDQDNILDSVPLAINYLVAVGDTEFKRLAVGCALGADTLELARSLLDSLPLVTLEDSTFFDYYNILISQREAGKTMLDLKGSELNPLFVIVNDEGTYAAMAEAILALHADSMIVRWHEELPEERRIDPEVLEQPLADVLKFELFPNPTNNDFTVKYRLPFPANELIAEVYDMLGRGVYRTSVRQTTSGEIKVSIAPCSGVYSVRLVADGKPVASHKLICLQK